MTLGVRALSVRLAGFSWRRLLLPGVLQFLLFLLFLLSLLGRMARLGLLSRLLGATLLLFPLALLSALLLLLIPILIAHWGFLG